MEQSLCFTPQVISNSSNSVAFYALCLDPQTVPRDEKKRRVFGYVLRHVFGRVLRPLYVREHTAGVKRDAKRKKTALGKGLVII